MLENKIFDILSSLKKELIEEIISVSELKEYPASSEIIREDQYIKTVPIVIDGLLKVYISNGEKELLLYHLRGGESSTVFLLAGQQNEPSKVYASAETDSILLLVPINEVNRLLDSHPDLNCLFLDQYQNRYNNLLDAVHTLFFEKMDDRIYKYLQDKMCAMDVNLLKMSHREIAEELGTAREVVSRAIKRLENEGLVSQDACSIKILRP